jgi:hypothetical protein
MSEQINSYFGESLLSKVIENDDFLKLKQYGVSEEDFVTNSEKQVFKFISDYAEVNRGQMPDYRTVVGNFPTFTIRNSVQDSYEFLVNQLKSYTTQLRVQNFMKTTAAEKFGELNGLEFIDFMMDNLDNFKQQADVRKEVGTDVIGDYKDFLIEYQDRKEGKSHKIWKSAFHTNVDYYSGNMYSWYGRSGRGKSILTMVEVLESAMQGATCLIWAMEMSKFEWLSRAYSYLSGRTKLHEALQKGEEPLEGFPVAELLNGTLNTMDETLFESFLSNLNEYIPGKIILRSVDDVDFYKRGCKQLESDILSVPGGVDVVLIDPIYYMDFERGTTVAGSDVANTSKKLRHIAGYYKCVIHVLTQAEEIKNDRNSNGEREIRVPNRSEIKKTKAVLEDAANTFGIDTCNGQFRIELGKGRNGGEGTVIEGIFLPGVGLVYEPQKTDLAKIAEELGF